MKFGVFSLMQWPQDRSQEQAAPGPVELEEGCGNCPHPPAAQAGKH